jgi:hypothetical protein
MANKEELIRQAIDTIARTTGGGDFSTAYANMLFGINHRGLGSPLKLHHDNGGITFFTRPDLNLTYDNLSGVRPLSPLLTQDEYTIQRAVRSLLDPRNSRGMTYKYDRLFNSGTMPPGKITSPLIDDHLPFITLLTNNLISLTGWPDQVAQFYESRAGVRKEVYGHIDSHVRITTPFDLTATFRNVDGDPISLLLAVWLLYASSVYVGDMVPYNDHIVRRSIDYNTRIYHFDLDPSRRWVTKTFAIGAGFPYTNPTGVAANFNRDRTFVEGSDQITAQFRCYGMDYNDPITIEEFNRLVSWYNPAMTILQVRESTVVLKGQNMIQLRERDLVYGNFRGYPLIHPLTNELMWFVTRDQYNSIKVG